MYRPSASIVVCTYNRADSLSNLLRGLNHLDYPNFEIIVVNGPSNDSTAAVLEKWSDRIKYLSCDVANLAVSRNLGISASAGEVVAFIDDDAVPHPKWLSFLATKYADERVGGVGGFTVDHTGHRFQSRKTLGDRYGNAHQVSVLFDERALNRVGAPLYPAPLGTNLSIRRSALLNVGGFDHTFAYFLDETDVCLRIVDAGYKIIYEPSALVFHQFAASEIRTDRRVNRTFYPLAISKSYFIMRHGCPHSIEEAGRQLTAFREEVLKANESMAESGAISTSHRVSLDQDLLRGIEAGTSAASFSADRTRGHLAVAKEPAPLVKFRAAQRMRIALVSRTCSSSHAAGIARWTWMVAKALADRGHVVHVITRSDGRPSTQFIDGYWTHAVPDDPLAGEVLSIDESIPAPLAARAAAVRQAIDYVKSYGLDVMSFPIWDVEGIGCTNDLDIAIVMSLHTTFSLARPFVREWNARPLQERFDVEPTIAAENRLLRSVPTILANSNAIVADLGRIADVDLSTKAVVVPHGTLDPLIDKPLRKNLRTPQRKRRRLLFVGRFEERKGFDIAALVFDKLLQSGLDIDIDLVGDNISPRVVSWLASLGVARLLKDERVRMGGVVDREQLDDMLAAADAVLLPSRYESFGLTAIEAMAAGAPVVALRTGASAEVVVDGVSGRLVPMDGREVESIVRALTSMIGDAQLLQDMSRGARDVFERRFTLEKMINSVEEVLIESIAQKVKGNGTRT